MSQDYPTSCHKLVFRQQFRIIGMVLLLVESLQFGDDVGASLVVLAVRPANGCSEADKVVAAHVLCAGVQLARPGQGHDHRGHQVKVSAVLRVPNLDGRGHVAVAQQHGPVHAVHPHVLTQTASGTTRNI